jgi:large subunit ribosomal protein L29
MKAQELRELDAEELGGRLKGARRELYELRFKLAVGQQDNHREIRRARKEIARILTVVHQRRLGAVEGDALTPVDEAPEAGETEETGDRAETADAPAEAVEPAVTPASSGEEDVVAAEQEGQAEASETAEGGAQAQAARRRRSRKAASEDET